MRQSPTKSVAGLFYPSGGTVPGVKSPSDRRMHATVSHDELFAPSELSSLQSPVHVPPRVPPSTLPRKWHVYEVTIDRGTPQYLFEQEVKKEHIRWSKQVFPSPLPTGRHEAVFLRRTLEGMLQELDDKRELMSKREVLAAEHAIYSTCCMEVVRQVTVQCHERGLLLKGLLESYEDMIATLTTSAEALIDDEVAAALQARWGPGTGDGPASGSPRSMPPMGLSSGSMSVAVPPIGPGSYGDPPGGTQALAGYSNSSGNSSRAGSARMPAVSWSPASFLAVGGSSGAGSPNAAGGATSVVGLTPGRGPGPSPLSGRLSAAGSGAGGGQTGRVPPSADDPLVAQLQAQLDSLVWERDAARAGERAALGQLDALQRDRDALSAELAAVNARLAAVTAEVEGLQRLRRLEDLHRMAESHGVQGGQGAASVSALDASSDRPVVEIPAQEVLLEDHEPLEPYSLPLLHQFINSVYMDKIRADLIGDAGDLPRASFVSFLEALLAEGEDPAADPSHPHPHPQSHPSHTPGPCGEDGTATPMGISRRVWVLESARAHCPSSLYCRAFLGLWGQAADVPTILSPGAGGRSGRSRRKHPPVPPLPWDDASAAFYLDALARIMPEKGPQHLGALVYETDGCTFQVRTSFGCEVANQVFGTSLKPGQLSQLTDQIEAHSRVAPGSSLLHIDREDLMMILLAGRGLLVARAHAMLKDFFQAADTNADGALSFEEFKELIVHVSNGASLPPGSSSLEELFERYSLEGGGRVTADSFAKAALDLQLQAFASLRNKLVPQTMVSERSTLLQQQWNRCRGSVLRQLSVLTNAHTKVRLTERISQLDRIVRTGGPAEVGFIVLQLILTGVHSHFSKTMGKSPKVSFRTGAGLGGAAPGAGAGLGGDGGVEDGDPEEGEGRRSLTPLPADMDMPSELQGDSVESLSS